MSSGFGVDCIRSAVGAHYNGRSRAEAVGSRVSAGCGGAVVRRPRGFDLFVIIIGRRVNFGGFQCPVVVTLSCMFGMGMDSCLVEVEVGRSIIVALLLSIIRFCAISAAVPTQVREG